MKKSIIILSLIMFSFASCTNTLHEADRQNNTASKLVSTSNCEKEDGVILVKLTDNALTKIEEGTFDINSLLDGLNEASLSRTIPFDEKSDITAVKHGLHKWFTITFDPEISPETAACILAQREEIDVLEYNSLLKGEVSSQVTVAVSEAVSKATSTTDLPFNDPLLKNQWNLINDGSIEGSVAGADINVKDAWKLTAGDPRVIVAVFDQGVAYDHYDLKASMWRNKGEIEDNGIDDDQNGYVDDIYGYNFAEGKGRLTYDDDGDHGTHVAGTIAATNNNGIGVSSVAGGSGNGDGVRIMSCQIFKTNGVLTTKSKIANAYHYAASNGACIAQCSYGYPADEGKGISSKDYFYSDDRSVERDAMKYFLDPANANCPALETNIVVFSSGNQNSPESLYPGAMKECISVTATCPDFLPGGYSNYGAGCDIAAPGGDIDEVAGIEAPCRILSTGVDGTNINAYIMNHGTSMACPHVTGVAALGASYAMKIGKRFSREEFISKLLSSAHNIDSYILPGQTKLNANDESYIPVDITIKKGKMGTGLVDAWNFLMALEGTPSFMTVPGQKLNINIDKLIGTGYTLEVTEEDILALGIENTPVIKDGVLEITCTKIGSGKIRFKASVGNDEKGEIPELDYYKYISIISRPVVATNGGWL